MLVATQGSEAGSVEAESKDGSYSTGIEKFEIVIEKTSEVAHGSTVDATDEDLLGHSGSNSDEGEVYLDTSNITMVPENHSDVDSDFNPDLPTNYGIKDQATPAKDVVIESEKTEIDGKSEKNVPVPMMKDSKDKAEAP